MQADGRRRQQARRHGLPVAVLQARHRRRRGCLLRQRHQQLLLQRLGLLLLPGHRSAKALRSQPWYCCGSGSFLIDFGAVSQIASICLRLGWVTSCRSAAPPGSKRGRGPGSSRFRRRLSWKLPPKSEAPGPLSAVPAPHRPCAVASMHFEDGKGECFLCAFSLTFSASSPYAAAIAQSPAAQKASICCCTSAAVCTSSSIMIIVRSQAWTGEDVLPNERLVNRFASSVAPSASDQRL